MELVADANSIIASLIKDGKSAEILSNFAFEFYTPEFLFEEIEKHKNDILRKSHRGKAEFFSLLFP